MNITGSFNTTSHDNGEDYFVINPNGSFYQERLTGTYSVFYWSTKLSTHQFVNIFDASRSWTGEKFIYILKFVLKNSIVYIVV